MIWLLVVPALIVAYIIWTLVFATAYRARHQRREQAGEAEASAFVAELRGLPAPGETIYTDHNVWLPRTPTAAELDELKERWLAAQDEPVRVLVPRLVPLEVDEALDLCAGCRNDAHCDGAIDDCVCTCTWPQDWDEEDEDEEPDPFHTPADVLPAWVIEALNGHDGVDAALDSIVARAVSDA